MRFGFGLPHAGAAANGPDISRFAQRVRHWASNRSGAAITSSCRRAARISIQPMAVNAPSTEGFLEPYTLLAYVAAATKTIKLGLTVIILPTAIPLCKRRCWHASMSFPVAG
jgi:hypothetical protein